VRAGVVGCRRVRGDDRLHDVQFAQHCGGEQVHARALRHQTLRDVASPHVRCGAEGSLPVAPSPVPRRVRECSVFAEQFLHLIEVAVRRAYERLNRRHCAFSW
jgi:hypothetical protein